MPLAHTREDLLAAMDSMEVWQEADGRSVLTDMAFFGLSDPIDDVTERVAELEAAGLAEVTVGRFGSRFWTLTAAGRAELGITETEEN